MIKKLASILVLCLSLACGVFSTPQPTVTPLPTATSTSVPTAKPTNTPVFEFNVGDMSMLVAVEGFSVSIPFPYIHDVEDNIIVIANEERSLFVSFTSDSYDLSPLETVIDDYLDSLEVKGSSFERSEPENIVVDGFVGVSINITGDLGGKLPIEGKAIAVSPHENLVLFGFATTDTSKGEKLWELEHQAVFEYLLSTIKFTDPDNTCIISGDETYGYTVENPIKVGGDFLTGVSRERVYLDNLLGPNGEKLSYERNGSVPSETSILDAYQITGSGIDEVLYIDIYTFETPQAPVGFTCKGEFPLTAP